MGKPVALPSVSLPTSLSAQLYVVASEESELLGRVPSASESSGAFEMAQVRDAFLIQAGMASQPDSTCPTPKGADYELRLAEMGNAWREDVKEKTLLKQKLLAAEAALEEARQQHALRLQTQLQQAEVAKLRMRIAEEAEQAATLKLKNSQTRVAELSTALGAAKRSITMLTEHNAKLTQDLDRSKSTIARLTLGDGPCSPVAAAAAPHLTFFNDAFTPANSLQHDDDGQTSHELLKAEASWRSHTADLDQPSAPLWTHHATSGSPRAHDGASPYLPRSRLASSVSVPLEPFYPTASRNASPSVLLDAAAVALLTSEDGPPTPCAVFDLTPASTAEHQCSTPTLCISPTTTSHGGAAPPSVTSHGGAPSLGGTPPSVTSNGGYESGTPSSVTLAPSTGCSIGGSSERSNESAIISISKACGAALVAGLEGQTACKQGEQAGMTQEHRLALVSPGSECDVPVVGSDMPWWMPRCMRATC